MYYIGMICITQDDEAELFGNHFMCQIPATEIQFDPTMNSCEKVNL